jgi:hypothetical protein
MRYKHATMLYLYSRDLRSIFAMRFTSSLILGKKKTKHNFLSVTKEPNCENGMDQRYLRAISYCVFQEKKKRNSTQNLGLAWNRPRPICSSGACPELFWDDDSYLGSHARRTQELLEWNICFSRRVLKDTKVLPYNFGG